MVKTTDNAFIIESDDKNDRINLNADPDVKIKKLDTTDEKEFLIQIEEWKVLLIDINGVQFKINYGNNDKIKYFCASNICTAAKSKRASSPIIAFCRNRLSDCEDPGILIICFV